ncbi:MAG: leucyl aminopeptidase [Allosphingosinicella sp.]|uniref:leucyl aminopeptidase n=1 Tax=Allosphingosinicella sp. TaxID=2823234 RepID=UPI003920EA45
MRLFAAAAALLAFSMPPADAARPVQFAAEALAGSALVLPLGRADDLASRGTMLDAASREAVARALEAARFEYRRNATLPLRGIGPWRQILVIGTGTQPLTAPQLQDIGGTAARALAEEDGPVAVAAAGLGADAAHLIALGARLGGYRFEGYRSEDPERPRPAGRAAPLTVVAADPAAAQARWQAGAALADGVFFARDLVTEPANIIYPESFVERTREAFRGLPGVTVRALDERQMRDMGMGAIMSVGQGSARPPRMLIVEYRGAGAQGAPIVLAGKGITFDSGGISIKGRDGMWRMKTDMAGAAAVTGAVLSLARSRAPVHVIAISGLAENMPSGTAARPGDVVRAYNGRSIELLNTDAEGRMVLADAVSYAERQFRPAAIVDVATLTGAIVTALGQDYAGLFARQDELADQLLAAGRATGEELWRMPLHPRYAEAMRSPIADIRDIVEGGAPGAGFGAHFIGSFVTPATPWAHIDIAGTAWGTDSPTAPAGATGMTVRLLDHFVRNFRPVAAAAPPAN